MCHAHSQKCGEGQAFSVSCPTLERGDKTELLEHAQPVIQAPVLHNLAVGDTSDGDGLSRSIWTGWQSRRKRVIDMIGGIECIESRQMLLVEHFLIETAYQIFIFL